MTRKAKNIFPIATALAFSLTLASMAAWGSTSMEFYAVVTDVPNGKTLVVEHNTPDAVQTNTLSLSQVKAPTLAQPGGEAARQALTKLVLGQKVLVSLSVSGTNVHSEVYFTVDSRVDRSRKSLSAQMREIGKVGWESLEPNRNFTSDIPPATGTNGIVNKGDSTVMGSNAVEAASDAELEVGVLSNATPERKGDSASSDNKVAPKSRHKFSLAALFAITATVVVSWILTTKRRKQNCQ